MSQQNKQQVLDLLVWCDGGKLKSISVDFTLFIAFDVNLHVRKANDTTVSDGRLYIDKGVLTLMQEPKDRHHLRFPFSPERYQYDHWMFLSCGFQSTLSRTATPALFKTRTDPT